MEIKPLICSSNLLSSILFVIFSRQAYITSDGEYIANMLLSSFKLSILGKSIYRSGSSVDVLESTAWIREVIIHYQKKKKIGNPCHKGTYSIKKWQSLVLCTRLEYGYYTMPPDVPRISLNYQNMDGCVRVSAEESIKMRCKCGLMGRECNCVIVCAYS
jgi:hypothetical protein